jgi:hypothetical protein
MLTVTEIPTSTEALPGCVNDKPVLNEVVLDMKSSIRNIESQKVKKQPGIDINSPIGIRR